MAGPPRTTATTDGTAMMFLLLVALGTLAFVEAWNWFWSYNEYAGGNNEVRIEERHLGTIRRDNDSI